MLNQISSLILKNYSFIEANPNDSYITDVIDV